MPGFVGIRSISSKSASWRGVSVAPFTPFSTSWRHCFAGPWSPAIITDRQFGTVYGSPARSLSILPFGEHAAPDMPDNMKHSAVHGGW